MFDGNPSSWVRLFNVLDAVEKKEEMHRMSDGEIFSGMMLVFISPLSGQVGQHCADVMLYYVKRCIAMPGIRWR